MLSAPCACACAISRSRSARRSSPAIALPRWLRPVTRGRRGLRAGHGTGHGTRHEPTHEQPTHEPKSKKRSLLTLVPDDAEDTAFQIYFAGKRAGRRRRGGGVAARADPAGRVGARVTAAAWLSRARASPSRGSLPSPSSAPGLGHVARGAARDSARQRRVRRLRGRVPRGAHTCRHRGASGRGCPHWPP